jgi:hypothetical protein
MRFYDKINSALLKFEERGHLGDDVYDRQTEPFEFFDGFAESFFKEFKKAIAQFKKADWDRLDSQWDDKSLLWKTRFIRLLEFADPTLSVPRLVQLMKASEPSLSQVAVTCLQKIGEQHPSLPSVKEALGKISKEQFIPQETAPVDTEAALRFKAKIYSQKNLKLNHFVAWTNSAKSPHTSCYAKPEVLKKLGEHLAAGIELANYFGESRRTYFAEEPTDHERHYLGNQFWLKALHFHVKKSEKSEPTVFSIKENEVTISTTTNVIDEIIYYFKNESREESFGGGWDVITSKTGSLFIRMHLEP